MTVGFNLINAGFTFTGRICKKQRKEEISYIFLRICKVRNIFTCVAKERKCEKKETFSSGLLNLHLDNLQAMKLKQ